MLAFAGEAGRFEGMLKAIVGYELRIEALRGTRKLGQTKGEPERRRGAEALTALGHSAIAAATLDSSPAFAGEGDQAKPGGGAAPQARSSGNEETGASRRPLHHSLREWSPSPRNLGEE